MSRMRVRGGHVGGGQRRYVPRAIKEKTLEVAANGTRRQLKEPVARSKRLVW